MEWDNVNKLRAYFWKPDTDAEFGLAVVAHNVQEAKQLGATEWGATVGHDDNNWWIKQRCNWTRDANVDGLDVGVVEELDGLRRGMYGWLEDERCDICKDMGRLTCVNETAVCSNCEEKTDMQEYKRRRITRK